MKITLSNSISLDLMLSVTRALSEYSDRDLSHLCVEEEDGSDVVDLCAYYPGNGMFPGTTAVIQEYRKEHKAHAEAFAADLNTLFNLTPPPAP